MKRFTLAPEAEQDLNNIWEYIAEDSNGAADRFIEQLHNLILALVEAPGMGHSREDLAENRPLLFWPVGSYLIIYKAAEDLIEIVAVAHGKRDIPAFFERRGV